MSETPAAKKQKIDSTEKDGKQREQLYKYMYLKFKLEVPSKFKGDPKEYITDRFTTIELQTIAKKLIQSLDAKVSAIDVVQSCRPAMAHEYCKTIKEVSYYRLYKCDPKAIELLEHYAKHGYFNNPESKFRNMDALITIELNAKGEPK